MTKLESGRLVEIGEELAHEHEYLGDIRSTYLEDGKVYAGTMGFLKVNEKKRKVKVDARQNENWTIPKVGDWIIGTVDYIRKFSLGIKVHILNSKLLIESGIYANVHISNASRKYVDNLEDMFQKNDVVRAKIIGKMANEWRLALNVPKTGIIYTECKYCGHELNRVGRDKLVCPFCQNTERKTLAPDYGNVRTKIDY